METANVELYERMELSEHEIRRRSELLGLGSDELALLRESRQIIEEEVEWIVNEFYEIQITFAEIAEKIGEPETFRRLHLAQRTYILDLFDGEITIDYAKNRLRIGMVHQVIGVDPKLYLSAMKLLKDIIFKSLQRHIRDASHLQATCTALDKLVHFDLALVFDTYIGSLVSEVERAKDRVELYARSLEEQVAERTRELKEKIEQLEGAMATVKKLEGVLPICAKCKKIRDDKKSWQQMEQYISEHSEAMFSHGLCPECYREEMSVVLKLKPKGP